MQIIIPMPGDEGLASSLARRLGASPGAVETRAFPDGETYLRYECELRGRDAIILSRLDRPNVKLLPLVFAADAARELGAAKVVLVAPYLCYMRQDRRFQPGEAVTSASFARMISAAFDGLVTVDPHLHRYRSLSEIYSIPAEVVQSAPLIARWIAHHEPNPVLIGPDVESEQWVRDVASAIGAPYRVLRKQRLGDRKVEISTPDLQDMEGRAAVLIDDIVSSGRTMIETAAQLKARGLSKPTCVAVHAILSDDAYASLRMVVKQFASTNSVLHPSNAIDLSDPLAEATDALLRKLRRGERLCE